MAVPLPLHGMIDDDDFKRDDNLEFKDGNTSQRLELALYINGPCELSIKGLVDPSGFYYGSEVCHLGAVSIPEIVSMLYAPSGPVLGPSCN